MRKTGETSCATNNQVRGFIANGSQNFLDNIAIHEVFRHAIDAMLSDGCCSLENFIPERLGGRSSNTTWLRKPYILMSR